MVYLEHWVLEKGSLKPNRDAEIIVDMLERRLTPVAERDSGWSQLFRDEDGTYWELTFPHSELQGGGPRRLESLREEAARGRYKFD